MLSSFTVAGSGTPTKKKKFLTVLSHSRVPVTGAGSTTQGLSFTFKKGNEPVRAIHSPTALAMTTAAASTTQTTSGRTATALRTGISVMSTSFALGHHHHQQPPRRHQTPPSHKNHVPSPPPPTTPELALPCPATARKHQQSYDQRASTYVLEDNDDTELMAYLESHPLTPGDLHFFSSDPLRSPVGMAKALSPVAPPPPPTTSHHHLSMPCSTTDGKPPTLRASSSNNISSSAAAGGRRKAAVTATKADAKPPSKKKTTTTRKKPAAAAPVPTNRSFVSSPFDVVKGLGHGDHDSDEDQHGSSASSSSFSRSSSQSSLSSSTGANSRCCFSFEDWDERLKSPSLAPSKKVSSRTKSSSSSSSSSKTAKCGDKPTAMATGAGTLTTNRGKATASKAAGAAPKPPAARRRVQLTALPLAEKEENTKAVPTRASTIPPPLEVHAPVPMKDEPYRSLGSYEAATTAEDIEDEEDALSNSALDILMYAFSSDGMGDSALLGEVPVVCDEAGSNLFFAGDDDNACDGYGGPFVHLE